MRIALHGYDAESIADRTVLVEPIRFESSALIKWKMGNGCTHFEINCLAGNSSTFGVGNEILINARLAKADRTDSNKEIT
jgi:hypothetical protein